MSNGKAVGRRALFRAIGSVALALSTITGGATPARAAVSKKSARTGKAQTYVLVHGAWHSGNLLEPVAKLLRAAGHTVHTPTLAGNRPGDPKTTGLEEAIQSLVDFFTQNRITNTVLFGHSYGGMVITGAADRLPAGSIRRIVYQNAMVPYDGENQNDALARLRPPSVPQAARPALPPVEMPDLYPDVPAMPQVEGGAILPFARWRDFLINDADEATARFYYAKLNPHPLRTFSDRIKLSTNPDRFPFPRSYINALDDLTVPPSAGGWVQLMAERLGQYRYVSMPGSHEVMLSNPELQAEKIIVAGRD